MATSALLCAAARRCPRSASAITRRESTGFHNLTIDGYSKSRKMPTLWPAESQSFLAAGHRWRILFFPNGRLWTHGHMSVYLQLADGDGGAGARADVSPDVEFKFSLLDQDGNTVPKYSRSEEVRSYFNAWPTSGFAKFVRWEDLEESGCLKDDRFTIRCDITVTEDCAENDDDDSAAAAAAAPARVVVPPSDLREHIGGLLWRKHETDVTIVAGGGATCDAHGLLPPVFEAELLAATKKSGGCATFDAHGWLLAARSPVFEAELRAATKNSGGARVHIKVEGVEPSVVKAMLHFMYTDTLPEMAEQETVAMARGLLPAAQRYKLERLKLMCEEMLSKRIDVSTVTGTLAAAKQHGCQALAAMCVEFIARPGNLEAVMETEEFEKFKDSCPMLWIELLVKKLT